MDMKPAVSAGNSPTSAVHEKYFVWMALLVTAITYLGTIRYDFVYDDYPQIVFNPFLRAWHYAPQFFVSSVWKHMAPSSPGNYYRPLFLLLMRACYSMFADRPLGWHLVTLGLHLTATWLAYVMVRKLTGQFTVAWLAALIFGVHPIHHEVIAWVSATTESLFTVLFLLAFLAYLKSRETSRIFWMSVSGALYALSLLSKETAIVLPLLMFAHAWIEYSPAAGQRTSEGTPEGTRATSGRFRSALLPAVSFLPVAIVYLFVRSRILRGLGHAFVPVSVGSWFLTLPSILLFYVKHWFLPVRLSESYDLFYQSNVNFAHVLAPALILLAVAGAIWMLRDRLGSRSVEFAVAWIMITLMPALDTFVFRPDELVHDRYFYLPSVGAAMLVALLIARAAESRRGLFGQPTHAVAAGLAVAVVLSFLGVRAVSAWSGEYDLFTRAHQVAPLNGTAINNLGATMIARQELQPAEAILESGYRADPSDFRFSLNLARVAYRQGDYQKANTYIQQTITLNPDLAEAYVYLGQIELKQKHTAEAQRDLRHAVDLNPYSAPYHTSYGIVLALAGDCASADQQFEAALTLNPGDAVSQLQMIRCRIALSRAAATKPGQP